MIARRFWHCARALVGCVVWAGTAGCSDRGGANANPNPSANATSTGPTRTEGETATTSGSDAGRAVAPSASGSGSGAMPSDTGPRGPQTSYWYDAMPLTGNYFDAAEPGRDLVGVVARPATRDHALVGVEGGAFRTVWSLALPKLRYDISRYSFAVAGPYALASAGDDGRVSIVEVASGRVTRTVDVAGEIHALCAHPHVRDAVRVTTVSGDSWTSYVLYPESGKIDPDGPASSGPLAEGCPSRGAAIVTPTELPPAIRHDGTKGLAEQRAGERRWLVAEDLAPHRITLFAFERAPAPRWELPLTRDGTEVADSVRAFRADAGQGFIVSRFGWPRSALEVVDLDAGRLAWRAAGPCAASDVMVQGSRVYVRGASELFVFARADGRLLGKVGERSAKVCGG